MDFRRTEDKSNSSDWGEIERLIKLKISKFLFLSQTYLNTNEKTTGLI